MKYCSNTTIKNTERYLNETQWYTEIGKKLHQTKINEVSRNLYEYCRPSISDVTEQALRNHTDFNQTRLRKYYLDKSKYFQREFFQTM